MSREIQTLKVDASTYDMLEAALYVSEQIESVGRQEVIFQNTVQFSGDVVMDIKVVNSEDGPWTEGVLFCGGNEIGHTEVGESLDGEYIVEYLDKEFCVVVERAEKAPPICPHCGVKMQEIGSVGIVQNDQEWDAECDRYDCPNGHTILVLETDRIVAQAFCEICDSPCAYDPEVCLCTKCQKEADGTDSPTT